MIRPTNDEFELAVMKTRKELGHICIFTWRRLMKSEFKLPELNGFPIPITLVKETTKEEFLEWCKLLSKHLPKGKKVELKTIRKICKSGVYFYQARLQRKSK